jgi:LAGLIDADG endonuclease
VVGDDPSSADNQQERPGFEQWVVGFVDGEGCFSVPIFRNHTCRIGWQVQPTFAVVQGAKSLRVLQELERYFGCGRVALNRRHDDHREDLYRFEVRAIGDLRTRILPFFKANPLRTAKRDEFDRFSIVIRMMGEGDHLTVIGLTRIARIVEEMNHRKPSRFLESSEAIRQPTPIDVRS